LSCGCYGHDNLARDQGGQLLAIAFLGASGRTTQRRVAKILNGIEADRKQAKSETSTDWFKRQREVSGKDVNFRDIETRLPRCEGQKLPVP